MGITSSFGSGGTFIRFQTKTKHIAVNIFYNVYCVVGFVGFINLDSLHCMHV